jgi:hypothetical protein
LKSLRPAGGLFFPARKGKYLLIRKITGTRPRRFKIVKAIAVDVVQKKQSSSMPAKIVKSLISISFMGK